MLIVRYVLLAAGLSMDCFAISITNGMCRVKRRLLTAAACALCYGLFQGALTCIGYGAGSAFAERVSSAGHYIAFVLLMFSGVKMLISQEQQEVSELSAAAVFFSAFATSLDALTVGVSLCALSADIITIAAVIAGVTFLLCLVGFLVGSRAGRHLGRYAGIFGGCVLILLALRVVLQRQ